MQTLEAKSPQRMCKRNAKQKTIPHPSRGGGGPPVSFPNEIPPVTHHVVSAPVSFSAAVSDVRLKCPCQLGILSSSVDVTSWRRGICAERELCTSNHIYTDMHIICSIRLRSPSVSRLPVAAADHGSAILRKRIEHTSPSCAAPFRGRVDFTSTEGY